MGVITASALHAAGTGELTGQRRLDRTSNGVLWATYRNGSTTSYTTGNQQLLSAYSTDNGATWTAGPLFFASGSSLSTELNWSMFIDQDDYLHLCYYEPDNNRIMYVRGTPNAAKTSFTLSGNRTQVTNTNGIYNYADLVAFRDPATTGSYFVHLVIGYGNSGNPGRALYGRLSIDSTGTVSSSGATIPYTGGAAVAILGSYGNTNARNIAPKIDFNHVGDGKTPVAGAPHLFFAWMTGSTGSGQGLRFSKATYSGGTWSIGTERQIDPGIQDLQAYGWDAFFDGTRFVMTGFGQDSGGNYAYWLHDRDLADTTTTLRYPLGNSPIAEANNLLYGSSGYDEKGNVYRFGTRNFSLAAGSRTTGYLKWTRSGETLSGLIAIDPTSNVGYSSARRGYAGQGIDMIYMDGTASPYSVNSGRVTLNQNPTAPTLVTADNVSWNSEVSNNLQFVHNDPDGDAASSYRVRYRPAGTSAAYQYLTGSTSAANGATVTVPVPAGTWVGALEWAAQTYDPSNAEGAWSATRTVTALPATLTGATGGQGGTSLHASALYNMAQTERALRALSLV